MIFIFSFYLFLFFDAILAVEDLPNLTFSCTSGLNFSGDERKILVLPELYPNISSNFNDFNSVYNSLPLALQNESDILDNQLMEISFYFLNFSYDFEIKNSEIPTYFQKIVSNFHMKPLLCSIIDIYGCISDMRETNTLIYVKTYFIIYVLGSLQINNIIFDGENMCNDSLCDYNNNFQTQISGMFLVEQINNEIIPGIALTNITFQNFHFKTKDIFYFIFSPRLSNIILEGLLLINNTFTSGFMLYTGNFYVNCSGRAFINISNVSTENLQFYSENNNDNFFQILDFDGSLLFENISFKNVLSSTKFIFSLFSLQNIKNPTVINGLLFMSLNKNLIILNIEDCLLKITNFQILDSSFTKSPLIINAKSFLYAQEFLIENVFMENSLENFILNYGYLNISSFAFSFMENFQIFNSLSNIIFENGSFSSMISNRVFFISNSNHSLKNIFFYDVTVSFSIFLFNSIQSARLEMIYFKNITSLSNIIEIGMVKVLLFCNIILNNLTTGYLLNPLPILNVLSLENVLISDSIFIRIIYITVNILVTFTRLFIINFSKIKGNYLIQFTRNDLLINLVLFENLLGGDMPKAYLNLGGAQTIVKNSTFINVGWKNNDTSSFFSLEDNVILYFWHDLNVRVENSLFYASNVSIHSGFILFTGGGVNLTLFNCILKHEKKEYLYSMGLTISDAKLVNFTKNQFINLECPNSILVFTYFMHIHGPVAFIGEALYARKSNNRIIIMSENIFENCKCKIGGSFCIINFNTIIIQNIQIRNSFAKTEGGAFAVISASQIHISSLAINITEADTAAIAIFQNIDKCVISDSFLTNSIGMHGSAFVTKNTKTFLLNNTLVYNIISKSFLQINSFSVYITKVVMSSIFSESGIFKILGSGELFLDNSQFLDSIAETNGGLILSEFGKRISIENIVVNNISSIKDGGVILVSIIETFVATNLFINASKTNFNGILLFQSQSSSSIYNLTNITCFQNHAAQGSCLFFDSESHLYLNNLTVNLCEGTPLTFKSTFGVGIEMYNLHLVRNLIKKNDNLIKLQNINLFAKVLLLEENQFDGDDAIMISLSNSFNSTLETAIILSQNQDISEEYSQKKLFLFAEITNLYLLDVFIQSKNNSDLILVLEAQASNIIVHSSIFRNLVNGIIEKGLITIDSSEIHLSSSFFVENSSPVLYILKSNLLMENCIFYLNKNSTIIENPNEIYVENINSIDFIVYMVKIKIIGGFGKMATIKTTLNITLLYCLLMNFNQSYEYQGFELFDISNIFINNTEFNNFFRKLYGAALCLINSDKSKNINIYINNSLYANNIAYIAGAIYIRATSFLLIENSNFSFNRAIIKENILSGIAGSLYFEDDYSKSSTFELQNNNFINNTAEYLINDIFSSICLKISKNNQFISLNDNLNYLSLPFFVEINSTTTTRIIRPGFPTSLEFQMIDCLNQTISFDSKSVGTLSSNILNLTNTILLKNTIKKMEAGFLKFDEFQVYTSPGTKFELVLTINIYNDFVSTLGKTQNSFTFEAINCSRGEILTINKACYMCSNGTYSSNIFFDEMANICLNCPDNAFCWNGSYIIPDAGYWKSSENSTLMVECLIPEACQYEIFNNFRTSCHPFHYDNLCYKCKFGYGKFQSNSLCEKCESLSTSQIIRALIIFILAVIYVIYNSTTIIKSKDEVITDTIFKIIINHLQRFSILVFSQMQIPYGELKEYFSQFNFINILTEDVFSNDCFLQGFLEDDSNFYFYKFLITVILPLLVSIFCFILFLLFSLKNKKSSSKDKQGLRAFGLKIFKNTILYFLISAFLCYSLIINTSLLLLDCRPISNDPLEKDASFLYTFPNIECWTGLHKYGAILSEFIGLFVWGALFPFILWKNIQYSLGNKSAKKISVKADKNKNKIKTEKIFGVETFHFFYKDYKKEYYYWECVVFIQKLLLTVFSKIYKWIDIDFAPSLSVLLLLIYFYYVHKLKPFYKEFINSLEFLSLIASLLSNIAIIFLSSNNIHIIMKYFLISLSFLVNLMFFLTAIGILIKNVKWRENFKKYTQNFKRIKNKISDLKKMSLRKSQIRGSFK